MKMKNLLLAATVVVIGVAGGGITDMDGKFTLSAFPNQGVGSFIFGLSECPY